MDMTAYAADPMSGWVDSWWSGRCTKPSCECDDAVGSPLCTTCAAEWDAIISDADVHPPEIDSGDDEDPWTAEQRDPEADDDVWSRHEAMQWEPEDA